MKKVAKNLKETEKLAAQFLKRLLKIEGKTARVVGLYGNLGAGKTAFVQALGRHLGIREKIVSPTFIIMRKFKVSAAGFKKLIHIDAYRLKTGEELVQLGWAEIIADPKNLVLIEWPEQVADIMPEHTKVRLTHAGETAREIEIS